MIYYSIAKSRVIYETLHTEVILVDFNTGNYFALVHVASEVWQMLEQGFSLEEMAHTLGLHYRVEETQVMTDLDIFFQALLKEGVILEEKDEESKARTALLDRGWQYEAPRMQVYTDVQNLLLLDPIHEVAEAGWPERG